MTKIMKDVDVVVHAAAYPHEACLLFSLSYLQKILMVQFQFLAAIKKKLQERFIHGKYGGVKFP